MAQLHIYHAIKITRQAKYSKSVTPITPIKIIKLEDRHLLDWRNTNDEATEDEVLHKPFDAVESYLHDKLSELMDTKT